MGSPTGAATPTALPYVKWLKMDGCSAWHSSKMYCEPLIFFIMIDDTFIGTENRMRLSLYADDEPVWKRRRNVQFITVYIVGFYDSFQKERDRKEANMMI